MSQPAGKAGCHTVIGGGPAGLEAARVAALRGHRVTLYEAGNRLGGQILLAARAGWRKDMISIADWLAAEVETLGVALRLNCFVEGPETLEDDPDIVITATGGLPDLELPEGGGDLALSTWDILEGGKRPSGDMMIYDETGGHGALSTASLLAEQAGTLELVTPDLELGRDVGGQNLPIYLRDLYRAGAILTPNRRLLGLRQEGNRLIARLWNEYARAIETREADHVVIDRGTAPADAPFTALVDGSRNLGETDTDALLAGRAQPGAANPEGRYLLFKIGDAVASRDLHAALLDANRLARAL